MLKVSQNDIAEDEEDMTYLTKRFQQRVKKHKGFLKKGNSDRTKNENDLDYKCGNHGHFMKDSQSHKHECQDIK